ncbi:hypothetical protein G6011_06146 [Alternaria panax]|uniref:C3H1-type domain-containing protein n=1 Tax=Alternaria panax TaxID=48097 RepID=A0AAD4FFZ7_9PLEO|nr:hypothetical protein G6011_06146 [Alternaria panax]
MAGKKRNHSDEATSQRDKRTKTKNVAAIEEGDTAFVPQSSAPEGAQAIAPVEVLAKVEKAIVPIAATTTKKRHEDDINSSDDESEIFGGVDGAKCAFPDIEAASDDIQIVTGDEADTTPIGSEDDDDDEQAKIEKADSEEGPNDIKLIDETAKPVLKSTEDDTDRKKRGDGKDDSVAKEKVMRDAAEKKNKEEEATERQRSKEEYFAKVSNIIFDGVETSLRLADLAMWVGVGTVGATDTRQITVDGVTVEITIKLLAANFGEKIHVDDDAGDIILPTTESPSKLTVDTTVVPTICDSPATPTANAPSAVIRRGKPTACRFGNECKKQATCIFDHSQSPTKTLCAFVNTNTGCNKGVKCIYTHEHEGQMCPFGTVRKECPNRFKCAFLHMDDDPPINADETPKFQAPDRPAVREASTADIAERAAANRASREASAASAPPPNAPTGPKSNKRSRGADDIKTGIQTQRFRHNYQTPTYFIQQQLQPQQWQAMPGFAPPPTQVIPPPSGYDSPQGQYIPAQVPYCPQQSFHNSGYASNKQHGRGRGRINDRTRGGGGRGRGRGNTRQDDRQQNGNDNGGGGTGQDLGIKVRGAAEGPVPGPSERAIKIQGTDKNA